MEAVEGGKNQKRSGARFQRNVLQMTVEREPSSTESQSVLRLFLGCPYLKKILSMRFLVKCTAAFCRKDEIVPISFANRDRFLYIIRS